MAEAAKMTALSDVEESRIEIEPFVRNLFIGRFDTTVLSYPDVLENDR